jgi:hypothetical protein
VQLGEQLFADVPPRPLTARERAVVQRLTRRTAIEALVAQARDAQVDGECRCGCGSVRLTAPGAAASERDMVALGSRYGDHLAVEATATAARQRVTVVLHVIEGLLHELEVFAGEEGRRVPALDPRRLREVVVTP